MIVSLQGSGSLCAMATWPSSQLSKQAKSALFDMTRMWSSQISCLQLFLPNLRMRWAMELTDSVSVVVICRE